ncbi:MAG: hypothetical protein R2710_30150 [Acidimicrobiales bacterium]
MKITGRVTRGGTLAYGDLASIDDAHVVDLVERVRPPTPARRCRPSSRSGAATES